MSWTSTLKKVQEEIRNDVDKALNEPENVFSKPQTIDTSDMSHWHTSNHNYSTNWNDPYYYPQTTGGNTYPYQGGSTYPGNTYPNQWPPPAPSTNPFDPNPFVPDADWVKKNSEEITRLLELFEKERAEAEGKECPRCEQKTSKWTGDDYICDECRGF